MVRPVRVAASVVTAPPADDRPTIVFLHGMRLSGAAWAAQVAGLTDAFHCLTPDLPGHGDAAGTPFTLDDAAAGIAELIEREAHGGRAIVVGSSLGGYVAMAVAAGWPERVAGLALSGATAEPVGARALAFRGLAAILRHAPRGALDRISRVYFGWRYPPAIADPIVAAGFSFEGGAAALRSLVGQRFLPRLASYPGPTLLVNGQYDLFFRRREGAFAAAAAHPRRVRIRRATHLTNLDQPRRFNAAIRDFARTIEGTDT